MNGDPGLQPGPHPHRPLVQSPSKSLMAHGNNAWTDGAVMSREHDLALAQDGSSRVSLASDHERLMWMGSWLEARNTIHISHSPRSLSKSLMAHGNNAWIDGAVMSREHGLELPQDGSSRVTTRDIGSAHQQTVDF